MCVMYGWKVISYCCHGKSCFNIYSNIKPFKVHFDVVMLFVYIYHCITIFITILLYLTIFITILVCL